MTSHAQVTSDPQMTQQRSASSSPVEAQAGAATGAVPSHFATIGKLASANLAVSPGRTTCRSAVPLAAREPVSGSQATGVTVISSLPSPVSVGDRSRVGPRTEPTEPCIPDRIVNRLTLPLGIVTCRTIAGAGGAVGTLTGSPLDTK